MYSADVSRGGWGGSEFTRSAGEGGVDRVVQRSRNSGLAPAAQ